MAKVRIIGVDPGLNRTGWGIVEIDGNTISCIDSGVIRTKAQDPISSRLSTIFLLLGERLAEFSPQDAAIEETYVNSNFSSSLKLAQARAAAIISLQIYGLAPTSYQAKQIKKYVAGYGGADKKQIQKMISLLVPGANPNSEDAADALGVALCHALHTKRVY